MHHFKKYNILIFLCLLVLPFLNGQEYKKFLIIVSSDNKHLEDIFKQDYSLYRVVCIDTKVTDLPYLKHEKCSEQLMITYPTTRFGRLGALWFAIHEANDQEIIIDLATDKFFIDSHVLSYFNDLYQKNKIWMTRDCFAGPITFYAWLFKHIKLEDLTKKNDFLPFGTENIFYPLFKMASGHIFFLPNFFIKCENNDELKEKKSKIIPLKYETFLKKPVTLENEHADLVVFSYNRPMQLYAFLESLERYVTGLKEISVICRSSNKEVKNAYKKVIKAFPWVKFIKQHHLEKGADFKEKTLKAAFETPSNYIVFAVDDIIVKDYIDISECILYLKKTQAYGFYLRLGENINHFYILDKPQIQPPLLPIDEKVYAWRFNSGGQWDWGCLASIDMTVHEKKLIKNHLESLDFDCPNFFEGAWSNSSGNLSNTFGLCYKTSKIVNLPLNRVQSDYSKNMGIKITELLCKFYEGYKIDINSLYKIDNHSAHIKYFPTYIKR